jgi:hypothetical protein
VAPVEVGLLRREAVQVPLAVGNLLPGRAAEDGAPVVGRFLATAVGEVEPLALRAPRACGQRRGEPGMLGRAVVRDKVDEDLQVVLVRVVNQTVETIEGAVAGIDREVVGDVVPVVVLR